MSLGSNTKKILLGTGIIASCTVLAFAGWQTNRSVSKDSADVFAEQFSNLPNGTSATIEYISSSDIYSRSLTIEKENEILAKAQNRPYAEQYMASYVLKTPSNDIDIILEIDKQRNYLVADLSGLPTHSTVGLDIADTKLLPKTPTDWSGRFRIDFQNIAEIKNKNICLKIDGLVENKSSRICHHVTDDNEGQVAS